VAVMDIGEHGDDLQCFLVRQQHAGPRTWTLGCPQRQQILPDERSPHDWDIRPGYRAHRETPDPGRRHGR
jgi:hypothetical protein